MSQLLDVKRSCALRTLKEYETYLEEFEHLKSELELLKENGDDHGAKKKSELYTETLNVLEDTRGRLFNYAVDLESYIKEQGVDALDGKCLEAANECLLNLSKKHPQIGYTFNL